MLACETRNSISGYIRLKRKNYFNANTRGVLARAHCYSYNQYRRGLVRTLIFAFLSFSLSLFNWVVRNCFFSITLRKSNTHTRQSNKSFICSSSTKIRSCVCLRHRRQRQPRHSSIFAYSEMYG